MIESTVDWFNMREKYYEQANVLLDSNDDGLRSMRRQAVVIISDPMPHRFIERRTGDTS